MFQKVKCINYFCIKETVSTSSTGKKVGGIVLDVITVIMLFAAFGAIFYSGFMTESNTMPLWMIALVTALGLLLLFCIGTVSCMVTMVKQNSLTAGFLAFCSLQLGALIVNDTVLVCLLIQLFDVQNPVMRYAYVISAAIVLIGYVASIAAYSDGILDSSASDDEEEAAEEDEMTEDEETVEEDEMNEDDEAAEEEEIAGDDETVEEEIPTDE